MKLNLNNPLDILLFYIKRGKSSDSIPQVPLTKPYFNWLNSTEELPLDYKFNPSDLKAPIPFEIEMGLEPALREYWFDWIKKVLKSS